MSSSTNPPGSHRSFLDSHVSRRNSRRREKTTGIPRLFFDKSPLGNFGSSGSRRPCTPPTALVAPQISTEREQEAGTSRRGPAPLTSTPRSTPTSYYLRNRLSNAGGKDPVVRSGAAFLISLQSSAGSHHSLTDDEHPGLLGLTVAPLSTPSGVYRNPRHSPPLPSTGDTQVGFSRPLSDEVEDPRLPSPTTQSPSLHSLPLRRESLGSLYPASSTESIPLTEQEIPPCTGSTLLSGRRNTYTRRYRHLHREQTPSTPQGNVNLKSPDAPTPEPTRKILAEHGEVIWELKRHIHSLEQKIEHFQTQSRPVSPFAGSSGFGSANTSTQSMAYNSGFATVRPFPRRDGFFGHAPWTGMEQGQPADPERSRSALELVEKDGKIARLSRKLERAMSDLELAHLTQNLAEQKSIEMSEENERLRRKNEELSKKERGFLEELGEMATLRGQREAQEGIIRELEGIINLAQEKWRKVGEAEELKKDMDWLRIERDALAMWLSAKDSETLILEKEVLDLRSRLREVKEEERRGEKDDSGAMGGGGVAERLADQRRRMRSVSHGLQSLLETTKEFRKKKPKVDLDKLCLIRDSPDTEQSVGDAETEMERSERESRRAEEALGSLHQELLDVFFLPKLQRDITMK